MRLKVHCDPPTDGRTDGRTGGDVGDPGGASGVAEGLLPLAVLTGCWGSQWGGGGARGGGGGELTQLVGQLVAEDGHRRADASSDVRTEGGAWRRSTGQSQTVILGDWVELLLHGHSVFFVYLNMRGFYRYNGNMSPADQSQKSQ